LVRVLKLGRRSFFKKEFKRFGSSPSRPAMMTREEGILVYCIFVFCYCCFFFCKFVKKELDFSPEEGDPSGYDTGYGRENGT